MLLISSSGILLIVYFGLSHNAACATVEDEAPSVSSLFYLLVSGGVSVQREPPLAIFNLSFYFSKTRQDQL
jgi:hypothetical protein